MNDLQKLDLSEKDFDLIVDGLENLPNKHVAGHMMGDMIAEMVSRNGTPTKFKDLLEEKKKKDENERLLLVEDVKILQGKILMLKRYLKQNNALQETFNIINNIK